MAEPAVDLVLDFVEGRLAPKDFERVLQSDAVLQDTLEQDPDLPPNSYVGSGIVLYLLQLDLSHPAQALSAQGALSEWLARHGVPHRQATAPARHLAVLRDAQPSWLSVDLGWLQVELLPKSEGRTGASLKVWLREELERRFRFVSAPPVWLQGPAWPIGPNGPLVFLGQIDVPGYFHDHARAYVFHDPVDNTYTTKVQVT